MISEDLVRRNDALVNLNYDDYQAAKARRNQTKYIQTLEQRINRLESIVDNLCEDIAKLQKR